MDGNNALYNLITIMFLLMTCLLVTVTALWSTDTMAVPSALAPSTEIPIPMLQIPVSWTPSNTPLPSNTPRPSLTPSVTNTRTPTVTNTATETPTNTITPTPSFTQTPTPSSTFTATFTPSDTATITLTPTSAVATSTPTRTLTAFPIVVDEFRLRPDLNEACNFLAVAGNAFDDLNQPFRGLVVNVRGPGLPGNGVTAITGSNTNYGDSGFEVRVNSSVTQASYTVQVQQSDGTVLSQPIDVTFSGNCDNVLLIRFKATRPI